MTKKQKQVIKEIIAITGMNLTVVDNNLALGAKVGKTTLKEMSVGMEKSIEKLQSLLEG